MLKYKYVFFSNKIHGSNFIKQHSETKLLADKDRKLGNCYGLKLPVSRLQF